MQKKKYAVVTYTTFDNKVRKQKQWMGKNGEAIFSNIIEYLATGKWPKEPEGWVRRLEWGLERHTPYKLSPGTTFQYAYRDCHTAAQMSYYNGLLKTCVIGSLANECEKNPDFAKAMLKEAAIRAKKKDEEHIAWQLAHGIKEIETHDFRNALTRAKNRIRYHQTKPDAGYGDEWKHFIAIIEEFELYTILKLRMR